MDPIRVICVDDNSDLVEVLRMSIDAEEGMETVACLSRADDLVEEVRRTRADVALIDLTMQGKAPLEAVREVAEAFPEVKTIVYSGYDDQATIDSVWEAGAWGFTSKHQPIDEVVAQIRRVASGSEGAF